MVFRVAILFRFRFRFFSEFGFFPDSDFFRFLGPDFDPNSVSVFFRVYFGRGFGFFPDSGNPKKSIPFFFRIRVIRKKVFRFFSGFG